MADDLKRLLWVSTMHGRPESGFVRVDVFIDQQTGATHTEVEYCATLGADWVPLPPVA